MGREIKRVPLDFDWSIGEVWKGFLNPYWDYRRECEACKGSGYGPKTRILSDQWYGWDAHFEPYMTGSTPFNPSDEFIEMIIRAKIERSDTEFYTASGKFTLKQAVMFEAIRMCQIWNSAWSHHLDQDDVQALVDGGRLYDFTHIFVPGQGWQKKEPAYTPTAKEVNLWSLQGFGHDGINQWVCVKAKSQRLGYELDCPYCNGSGDLWPSKEAKQSYDNWEKEEPPAGEGWQVWETVTEGSPISPVFASDEDLVNWLIREGYSEGAAEQFVKSGWVPTMVMVDGGVRPDIESLNIAQLGD